MTVLFVTWDGPTTSYLDGLFLPILDRMREPDDAVHVLQFGWGLEAREPAIRAAAAAVGIPYRLCHVGRTPVVPATVAAIARGALDVVRYARSHRVDVLMPRSIISAAMALLALRWLPGVRLVYDADGLMADERVEFGGWNPSGPLYRALRAIEDAAVGRADIILTRTHRAVEILEERSGSSVGPRAVVVANGRDEVVFSPGTETERLAVRTELGLPADAPLVASVGSIGPQYRPEETFGFFGAVRRVRPDAHLLVLTGQVEEARRHAEAAGLPDAAVHALRVAPEDVPRYVRAADLGMALRTPSLSQRAVAPIKIGEYLLCGVPVLGTAGIGDIDHHVDAAVGALESADESSWSARRATWFAHDVLPDREGFRVRCRQRGLERFSLTRGAADYRRALEAVRGHQ